MKIISFLPVSLMLIGFMTGIAMAEGTSVSDTAFATAGYVKAAYTDLNGKKQEKLTNSANAGTNISIDDTTKKINLDLSKVTQVTGDLEDGADGVYVLTATITNGKATLKWEKIERGTRDGDM